MSEGALISPTVPCPTCAHAVVCAIKTTLEHHAGQWRLPPAPDPLISIRAQVTVECAEYLPLAEVKPHILLDRLLDPDHTLFQDDPVPAPAAEPAGLTAIELADRIVVQAIERDPEISYKQLAPLAGISDGTIRYRLLRLSKRGELSPALEAWRIARTAHQVGGPLSPTKPVKTKRARQSTKLAADLAHASERVLGEAPAADPAPVLDRVHESLQAVVAEQFETAAAVDRAVVVMPFPNAARMPWAPACKSPADWLVWRDANAQESILNRLDRPCDECPLAFAVEMFGQGRCNGRPRGVDAEGVVWPPVVQ